ncbi:uncharacterized protein TEOVI_000287200 [Trypanosoma equiperdum]|uniref:Rab3-GAP regulatory subunit N-terminal domain-containing protein n=1 Tax=Trypanosoma equiperdum TaxID=5694 RepID=A0A1G4IG61_TRYEQ|nr:hypothetical protein, conserved [Trypanosoma equiperdum]
MASLCFTDVGTLCRDVEPTRSFPASPTCIEVLSGVHLIASVNARANQCIVELLVGDKVADTFSRAGSEEPGNSGSRLSTPTGAGKTPNFTVPTVDTAVKEWLDALRASFRTAKVLDVLKEDEGVVTAIEFVRDVTRASSGGEAEQEGVNRSVKRPYVHLFIGTSRGTVVICNALRGTIMAIAMFQDCNRFVRQGSRRSSLAQGASVTSAQCTESVVRFAAHMSTLDTFLNPNVPQNTSAVHSGHLNTVYIVMSSGRVVALGRGAIDVFLETAEGHLDGARPHLVLEWVENSTFSSFPVAGPAARFASHVRCILSMSEVDPNTGIRLRAPRSTAATTDRSIKDAAFYLSCKCDTTDVLTDGPENREYLLLCGRAPALASYACKKTEKGFSARQAIGAVASMLGGVKRLLWAGGSEGEGDESSFTAKGLSVSSQSARNVFPEGDMTFDVVQVDPTLQWVACYSESAGRIYVYDLMGDAVCQVVKGCRSVEFQWHVATIGGKRMLLLVIHRILRHSVEMYSLRLGRRVAARYVPSGSILLRSGSSVLIPRVLMLVPDGVVTAIEVKLDRAHGALPSSSSCISGVTLGRGRSDTVVTGIDVHGGVTCVRGGFPTPYDVLVAALSLPLPNPVTEGDSFDVYCLRISKLEDVIKRQFSPGVFDDCCLPVGAGTEEADIPPDVSAAQCLNYVQLRLVCVASYRRALFNGVNTKTTQTSLKEFAMRSAAGPVFTAQGELHPILKGMVGDVTVVLLAKKDETCFSHVASIIPSLEKLLMRRSTASVPEGDPTGPVVPMSLGDFLKLFYCGGHKLAFLRESVGYANGCVDSFDEWAEIGSVFFGGGVGCFPQQVDVFNSLGFRTVDVVMMALCWLCRSFARTLSPSCLGTVAELLFFLRNSGEEAFLTGVEAIPCLIGRKHLERRRSEAHVSLLTLLVLLRQREKPFGSAYRARYELSLKRLLGLHLMIIRYETPLEDGDGWDSQTTEAPLYLSLCDLLPQEGGDALNILLLRQFPPPLTLKLCSEMPGSNVVKEALAGVDHLHWVKQLFMMNAAPPPWAVDAPWYREGTWDHVVFLSEVIQPTIKFFKLVTQGTLPTLVWVSAASSKQLAGLSVLLVVGLAVLERELTPLRCERLAFLTDGMLPDSNLFEGNETGFSDYSRHPLGSRSTRDYFNSCREFLHLNIQMVRQLLGGDDYIHGKKVADSVVEFLSVDDGANFPLVPVELRRLLYFFTVHICGNLRGLLQRLREACCFMDTVAFFAFKTAGSLCLPSLQLPAISWVTMFEDRSTVLCFLKGTCADNQEGKSLPTMVERMKARSELVRMITFADVLDTRSALSNSFVEDLSEALGLNHVAADFHLLVLLDVCSRLLLPSEEVCRFLNNVASRHLAALIAVFNCKLLIKCCFGYYADAKKTIPSCNRQEKQRLALKVQGLDDAMSEDFRCWVHSNELEGDEAIGSSETVDSNSNSQLEYRLFWGSAWCEVHYAGVVKCKVMSRLDQSQDSEKLRDFHRLLFVLARTAAEGASTLPLGLRRIACELPSVAARVTALI